MIPNADIGWSRKTFPLKSIPADGDLGLYGAGTTTARFLTENMASDRAVYVIMEINHRKSQVYIGRPSIFDDFGTVNIRARRVEFVVGGKSGGIFKTETTGSKRAIVKIPRVEPVHALVF